MAFISLTKQNRLPKDLQMIGMETWDVSEEPLNYFLRGIKKK